MEQNNSMHKDSALIRLPNGASAPSTACSGKTIGEGMKEQNSFGVLLKRYRLAAGLSQEALATRANLSARTISDLERGVHGAPRPDTLALLTNAMSLSDNDRNLLLSSARPELASFIDTPPRSSSPDFPLPPTRLIGRE